jgi:hypothetical protein
MSTPARVPLAWGGGRSLALAVAAVSRAGPEAAVLAGAAVLRLAALGRVSTDPYYDAAVRTMGTSWQAFLDGAFEPGRRVAIDKPAPGLWLQVASTRLLGFGHWSLLLPAALAGVATVAALMWLVRSIAGRWAGVAAGAALAVLPAAVVTARSDTMDSVMAALAVVAAGLALRAARSGRLALLAAAGALAGLAFEVKLVEALVPAAAVLLVWLAGAGGGPGAEVAAARVAVGGRSAEVASARPADGPTPRRGAGAAVWCGAFVACALAWLVAVTVIPLHPRPWALGSSDGSPWSAALVYDGIDRLLPSARPQGTPAPVSAARTAAGRAARRAREAQAAAGVAAPAGPLRLLSARRRFDTWIGVEAVAALAALAVALALGRHVVRDRPGRGAFAALAAWLVAGLALSSVMPGLRPRYLELVDPAVAGVLGIGVAALGTRIAGARFAAGPPGTEMAQRFSGAAVLGAVLVVPLLASLAAVRTGSEDSGAPGALPPARIAAMSAYLARHPGELAAAAPGAVAPLVARDALPVVLLSDGRGRQLVGPRGLRHVRYALLGPPCVRGDAGQTGCLPVVRWARAHGRATGVAGLYRLRRARVRAARGRTPTSSGSPRTARAGARHGRRRASRAQRRRAAPARRRSAARSAST